VQERNHEASLLRQQGTQRVDPEFDFVTGEIETIRCAVFGRTGNNAALSDRQ